MALDDTQKLSVRLALGEPISAKNALETCFSKLNAAEETKLKALIVEYDADATNVTDIQTGGVTIKPQDKVALVRNQIADLLGWDASADCSVLIGRGYVGELTRNSVAQNIDPDW